MSGFQGISVNGEVFIDTIDGKLLQAAHDASVPDTDRRAQSERLDAIFDKLAGSVLGTSESVKGSAQSREEHAGRCAEAVRAR